MRPAGWTGFTLSKIKAKRDLTEAQLQPELWRDHPRSISHLFPTKSMFWLKSWKSFITAPKGIRPQHLVGSLDSSQEGNTALSLKMFLVIYPTNGPKYSQYWEPAWKCPSMIYPRNVLKYCDYSEPDPGVAVTQVRSVIPGTQKNSTEFHLCSTDTGQGFHTLLQMFVLSTDQITEGFLI